MRKYPNMKATGVQHIFKLVKNPNVCTVDHKLGVLHFLRKATYEEEGGEEIHEKQELQLTKWSLNDGLKL